MIAVLNAQFCVVIVTINNVYNLWWWNQEPSICPQDRGGGGRVESQYKKEKYMKENHNIKNKLTTNYMMKTHNIQMYQTQPYYSSSYT